MKVDEKGGQLSCSTGNNLSSVASEMSEIDAHVVDSKRRPSGEDADNDGTATKPEKNTILIPPSDIYSDFIAASPWRMFFISLAIMILFSALGVVVSIYWKGGIKIGGSSEGFEARGTTQATYMLTAGHVANMECQGKLSARADGVGSKIYRYSFDHGAESGSGGRSASRIRFVDPDTCFEGYVPEEDDRRRRLEVIQEEEDGIVYVDDIPLTELGKQLAIYGENEMSPSHEITRSLLAYSPHLVSKANFEVTRQSKYGITLVLESIVGADMWSVDSIVGTCSLDNYLQTEIEGYSSQCHENEVSQCQPSRTIGNYVAALTGLSSCSAITDTELDYVKSLLLQCRPFYDDLSLMPNCWHWENDNYVSKYHLGDEFGQCDLQQADEECAKYNAVYDIFSALSEKEWMKNLQDEPMHLTQIIMANDAKKEVPLRTAYYDVIVPLLENKNMGFGDIMVKTGTVYLGFRNYNFNAELTGYTSGIIIVFIIVYLIILTHTGSLWITTCGFFQLFMAFFWGYTLYQVVIWRSFFPFLNLISFFLVIGIGSDDIFVYMDAWKQSFTQLPPYTPLANRISWTLRRAGSAMFVTSMTTCVSFAVNVVSPITALKGFGLFTAMVVLSDFLLMLVFIPAVVAVHYVTFAPSVGEEQLAYNTKKLQEEDGVVSCGVDMTACTQQTPCENILIRWMKFVFGTDGAEYIHGSGSIGGLDAVVAKPLPIEEPASPRTRHGEPISYPPDGQTITRNLEDEDIASPPESPTKQGIRKRHRPTDCIGKACVDGGNCQCKNCICCSTNLDYDPCRVPTEHDPNTGMLKRRWSEDIFEFYIAPFVIHRKLRWIFCLICIGCSCYLLTKAVHLSKPSSDYMQLLDKETSLEQYHGVEVKKFDIGSGMNSQFRYRFYFGLKAIDNGDMSNPFDRGEAVFVPLKLSEPATQEYILDLCDSIDSWSMTPPAQEYVGKAVCGPRWFKDWMEYPCGSTADDTGNPSKYLSCPERTTCCGKTPSEFPYAKSEYDSCLKSFATTFGSHDRNSGFFFDIETNNLKVLLLEGVTLTKFNYNYDVSSGVAKALESFYSNARSSSDMPKGSGLDEGFATSNLGFYALQEAVADGAVASAKLACIFACVVLITVSRRIISSIFAAFQISLIVIAVTGIAVSVGWELNVIESVVFSLSVGLSCDFAAHLAHSFNSTTDDSGLIVPYTFPITTAELNDHMKLSEYHATKAITELGVTVSMGFLTTFATGVVLLTGPLYFFQQFGTFLVSLMVFSYVYAFWLLMPLLASFGWIDRLLSHKLFRCWETFVTPSAFSPKPSPRLDSVFVTTEDDKTISSSARSSNASIVEMTPTVVTNASTTCQDDE